MIIVTRTLHPSATWNHRKLSRVYCVTATISFQLFQMFLISDITSHRRVFGFPRGIKSCDISKFARADIQGLKERQTLATLFATTCTSIALRQIIPANPTWFTP